MKQFGKFGDNFVEAGKKVLTSASPELVTASTFNTFRLNDKARKLIGITPSEKDVLECIGLINIIDQGANADDNNERFFATPGFKIKKDDGTFKFIGSRLQKDGNFTYSPVYSAMVNASVNTDSRIMELTKEDMVRADLLVMSRSTGGTKSFIALKKVRFDIKPVFIDNEGQLTLNNPDGEFDQYHEDSYGKDSLPIYDDNDEVTKVPVFLLTNMDVQDHTPQVAKAKVEEDNEAEEVDTIGKGDREPGLQEEVVMDEQDQEQE